MPIPICNEAIVWAQFNVEHRLELIFDCITYSDNKINNKTVKATSSNCNYFIASCSLPTTVLNDRHTKASTLPSIMLVVCEHNLHIHIKFIVEQE